jgi:hypothetical protein
MDVYQDVLGLLKLGETRFQPWQPEVRLPIEPPRLPEAPPRVQRRERKRQQTIAKKKASSPPPPLGMPRFGGHLTSERAQGVQHGKDET